MKISKILGRAHHRIGNLNEKQIYLTSLPNKKKNHIKITMRYYEQPQTMAKIIIPSVDENMDQ